MSVPKDGLPADLPDDLREVATEIAAGAGTPMLKLVRSGCGCHVGTVTRLHGHDYLTIRRRVLVTVGLTADGAERTQARLQYAFLMLPEDEETPIETLTDYGCKHSSSGRSLYLMQLSNKVWETTRRNEKWVIN